jgi:hypothetical protein
LLAGCACGKPVVMAGQLPVTARQVLLLQREPVILL